MKAGTVVLTLYLLLGVPGPAPAATPDEVARSVSERVMSPYCPGVTLHDCASGEALDLRERITSWAAQGMSEAAIMDRLEAEFGPSIRAEPASGVPAWILPAALLPLGAVLVAAIARRLAAREPAASAPSPSSAEKARLEAALDEMRGRP